MGALGIPVEFTIGITQDVVVAADISAIPK